MNTKQIKSTDASQRDSDRFRWIVSIAVWVSFTGTYIISEWVVRALDPWWSAKGDRESTAELTRVIEISLCACFPVVIALIWRNAIEWSSEKAIAFVCALLVTVSVAALVLRSFSAPLAGEVSNLVYPLSAWAVLGSAMTIIQAWAYYSAPSKEGGSPAVACMNCGYDLRGQRECRCPECGHEFTLGQLSRRE